MNMNQVKPYIQKHYPNATALTPLTGGLVSQTFSFRSNNEKYIFQTGGARDDYEKQRYVSKQYRGTLPVREVLRIHETDDGTAYCISRYIEGRKLFDLSDHERQELVMPIMDILSQMAQSEIPADAGYGRFDATGHAPYQTWVDFVSAIYNDSVYDWPALVPKGFNDAVVRKAIAVLHRNIHCLEFEKSCLVHGDMGSYNIITSNGHITGLIDWGLALYGDPLYDIANLLFWDEKKLMDLNQALKHKHFTNETDKQKLTCYALRIGLEEIYNTVVLNHIGYGVKWVSGRVDEVLKNGL